MSFMFEVYYRSPADTEKETTLQRIVESTGGRFDCREPAQGDGGPIILTFEFDDFDQAAATVAELRRLGEHVKGPFDYGD